MSKDAIKRVEVQNKEGRVIGFRDTLSSNTRTIKSAKAKIKGFKIQYGGKLGSPMKESKRIEAFKREQVRLNKLLIDQSNRIATQEHLIDLQLDSLTKFSLITETQCNEIEQLKNQLNHTQTQIATIKGIINL